IDAAGALAWPGGVRLTNDASQEIIGGVVPDAAGGAIVYYSNDFCMTGRAIVVQRLDATGALRWGAGVPVCVRPFSQQDPAGITDGRGGAIFAWSDLRSGADFDVYAQRVDSTGAWLWKTNGSLLGSAVDDQRLVQLCTDGGGGAIATWQDFRSPTESDVYAQRVDSTGVLSPVLGVDPVAAALAWSVGAAVPNPSRNGSIELRLSLPVADRVDTFVLDALGRRVRQLHGGRWEAGIRVLAWDGRDSA